MPQTQISLLARPRYWVAAAPVAALAADGPPLSNKAGIRRFWMTANRPAEDPKYLERRAGIATTGGDQLQRSLWTPADKRAFLMTPRNRSSVCPREP